MKTLRITSAFLILLLTVFAATGQSKSDKLYEFFDEKDGITSFSFSKNMLDVINIEVGEDENEKDVTGDLHRVRFLSYNPQKGNFTGPGFLKKAISLLPSRYKKYQDPNGEYSDSEIWLLGRKKNFSECHLFIKNENENQLQFVVSFYGDFHVNDIKKLNDTGHNLSAE